MPPYEPMIKVTIQEGEKISTGRGRDEGDCWWIAFDDGRAYSVPRKDVKRI